MNLLKNSLKKIIKTNKMDKKTKLWLGAGIVGVGAYLLWKSKNATTPAVTAPAAANMVGFLPVGDQEKFTNAEGDKFAGVGERLVSAEGGDFAGVMSRQISQDGTQFFDVKGGKVGIPDAGIFAKSVGEKKPLVGKENVTSKTKFATGDADASPKKAAQLVGANGAPTFFSPRTARFGKGQGIFLPKPTPVMDEPKRKTPVEPMMPVTQAKPSNNMVGFDSGLINGPAVHGTNW